MWIAKGERVRSLLLLAVLAGCIGALIGAASSSATPASVAKNKCTKHRHVFYGDYRDPWTGETVSNPRGQTPEKYGLGRRASWPIALGAYYFLESDGPGWPLDAVDNLKRGLAGGFAGKLCPIPTEISIDIKHITMHHDGGGNWVYAFRIRTDRRTIYRAAVTLHRIYDVQVTVSTVSGKRLYSSPIYRSNE